MRDQQDDLPGAARGEDLIAVFKRLDDMTRPKRATRGPTADPPPRDASAEARPAGRVYLSHATEDPRWDSFLAGVPGDNHTQTSLWAQVKATVGWRAVRVLAERNDRIVGGAQILYRHVLGMGALGYIPHGPVLAEGDQAIGAEVMAEIERALRSMRVRVLAVQPPGMTEHWPSYMGSPGYVTTDTQLAPRATSVLDVSRDPDEILSAMATKTRYNVRLSGRRSVVVREGTEDDLDTYYRMLQATASRQGFTPLPERYFKAIWETMAPRGHLRFALAEVDGRAVSGQLAIAFGDTVNNKLSVWSGEAGRDRPNEALQWSTIRWAHDHGYRSYDFEGLDLDAARALLRNEPLPPSLSQSVTSFKLGFGGDVVLKPPVGLLVPNAALRWVFTTLQPSLSRPGAKDIVNRLRVRSNPR